MPTQSVTLRTEVYQHLDNCETILRDVYERSGNRNPFLTVEWLKLWWKHFHEGKVLHIVTFVRAQEVVGFAPFYYWSVIGELTEFHLLGEGASSYLDIVSLPGLEADVTEALMAHFEGLRKPCAVHLHDFNNRFSKCFPPVMKLKPARNVRRAFFLLYPCPLASLGNDWEEFYNKQRDRKSRYNLRRAEQQLQRLGKCVFRQVTDPADVKRLWPELQRIHEERFSETVNPLLQGVSASFLCDTLSQLLGKRMSLSVTELDGVPVSFLIGFSMDNVFVDYAPAFDPAFANISLGQVHLRQLIQQKMSQGFQYFDFSKGEANYKRWWSNEQSESFLLRFGFNLNGSGWLYWAAWNLFYRMLLSMREKGMNTRLKRMWACLRNPAASRTPNEVGVTPLAEGVHSKSAQPWSYQLVHDLPCHARRALVQLVLKHSAQQFAVEVDTTKDTARLFLYEGGGGYEVCYGRESVR